MKAVLNYMIGFCYARQFNKLTLKILFISSLVFSGIQLQLQAQDDVLKKPSWWFGTSVGANNNLYHGSIQVVNSDLTIPATFQNTKVTELFACPVIEFHRPDSKLGFTLNFGYDNRSGSFDSSFTTKLAYITVEPSIRLNLFHSPFYVFSGPRIAFNVDKRFVYLPDMNSSEVTGDFSAMKKNVYSMQFGGGYDLALTDKNKKTQIILSPFASFHPYFGQNPRTIESWNLTTIRAGISLKFGNSLKKVMPEQVELPVVIAVEPDVRFVVNDSRNLPVKSSGDEEVYPLKNYVYFNLRTDENVSPVNDQAMELNENQMVIPTLANLSDSSYRQMIVFDNFLSKLGEQMTKNPSSTIKLIGSSKDGVEDGQKMAEAIKVFLVDVYGIDASRISIKTRKKIKIHSERQGGENEIALLQERSRQVLIKSNSGNLQMEFRGSGLSVKPVIMNVVEEANVYSTITFKTEGAEEGFSSWTLKITDDQGQVQNFGPFNKELITISGKSILGNRTFGKFDITMIGQLNSGKAVAKDTTIYLSHWTPPIDDKVTRYKILYEYNNSKAINIYNRYLTDVILPNIPPYGKVVIHGHTENITYRENSPELFLIQANNARNILENALQKIGRTDVQIEVYDFGKDQIVAPFQKSTPLDNLSNRTVIIDIISKK
jgi:hypothetical protein